MIANTRVFGDHLDKDVDRIFFDEYAVTPSQFEQIAKVQDAPPGDHYTEAELSPLGDLRFIPEGGAVEFDVPKEGHRKSIYYDAFGLGFQITPQMAKDDLTQNFMQMPQKLAKSAALKPNYVFFDLFNSGFTTQTAWDGQPVFDEDHVTLKSGQTIANEPSVPSALSETSYLAALEYFDNLIDEAGHPLEMQPNMLIVPNAQRYSAQLVTKNEMELNSANRNMNQINPANGIVNDYQLIVSRFLTDEDAWFVLAPEHNFYLFWKEQPELTSADDFHTGNALFKVWERFGAFVMGYKGAYGNPGA